MNSHRVSRRAFMKSCGLAGAGVLLGGVPVLARHAAAAAKGLPAAATVPVRPFGQTGVKVSMLALGGMFDIAENQALLRQALQWGVTYWDTADCFGGGRSEEGIGQYFRRNPAARRQVFLATKGDDRTPEGLTRLLAQSLERLQTDYIDLYCLHGVGAPSELSDDIKAWAERARNDGRIRWFGFSTHGNMQRCLTAAAKLGWVDAIMFKYDFRLMHTDSMRAAVDACAAAGIGLTAMKTQGGGPVRVDSMAELRLAGRFLQLGFTEAQARLKAVWDNPQIAAICSQMPNLNLLAANVAAALDRTRLTALDHELLQQYAQDTRCGYCAGCAALCENAVGGQAPIADLMRALMYARQYREPGWGREVYARIPAATRARLATLDYGAAERQCPQGLPIARLVREAGELLA